MQLVPFVQEINLMYLPAVMWRRVAELNAGLFAAFKGLSRAHEFPI